LKTGRKASKGWSKIHRPEKRKETGQAMKIRRMSHNNE
jgi:hypothetical protein